MDEQSGKKGGASAPGGIAGSVSDYLSDVAFPKAKGELVDILKKKGAPDWITSKIEAVPDDKFNSLPELLMKLGGKLF